MNLSHWFVKHSIKTYNALFFIFLFFVFIYLFKNQQLFYVPDSDFFQYIEEGKMLITNPFSKVVTPPLFSIIIYLFEKLLPFPNSGITGGITLNIFCFLISLFYLYKILRKQFLLSTFFPIVLLALNPLSHIVHLQPLNIPLATMLICMAIYYNEKFPIFSYVLTFLAFLVRPESVALFMAFVLKDILNNKKLVKPLWLFVFGIITVFWYLRPALTINGSDYYSEITARRQEIPNITFIRNSLITAPFLLLSENRLSGIAEPFKFNTIEMVLITLVLVWISIGAFVTHQKKLHSYTTLFFYTIFYILLHMFFPDSVLRYSYPVLPFIYILLFWPAILINQTQKISEQITLFICMGVVFIFISVHALTSGRIYIENQRWIKAEKRLIAEWFNKYTGPLTLVYSFEYWISKYYSTTEYITYKDTSNQTSWSDICNTPNDVYIVIDNQAEEDGQYFDKVNGQQYFSKIWNTPELMENLQLIKTLRRNVRWARIYKYNKELEKGCTKIVL